jgi:hypothetical protein
VGAITIGRPIAARGLAVTVDALAHNEA